MRATAFFLGVTTLLSSCYGAEAPTWSDETESAPESAELALRTQSLRATCTVRIGAGGATHEYTASLDEGDVRTWDAVPASEFVRSTTGPCHFSVFNGEALSGKHVVLGTNLTQRIRAGVDGLTRKDTRGGATWQIRSLSIARTSSACRLRVGGNGVRMDYHADYADQVPAMDRVDFLSGRDCGSNVYAGPDFGARDPHHRFKALHPTSTERAAYDPGFAIQSLSLWRASAECPEIARDQGRCLPQISLARSVFVTDVTRDQDRDGLDDALENELAEAFAPVHYNHSTEDATRSAIYVDATGEPALEPATVFQVTPHGEHGLRIQYMRLWRHDVWGSPTCPGHAGDSQRNDLYLSSTAPSATDHGHFWYVVQTGGGIQDDLAWHKGDDSLRGVHFVRRTGEIGPARHLALYFSKGKHHEYADAGWSGRPDKECAADIAYVDGQGHLHDPSYPSRLASLRSPPGHGDRFDYANVGSRAYPFFGDLAAFGFAGECVWDCGDFYAASSPSRGFD